MSVIDVAHMKRVLSREIATIAEVQDLENGIKKDRESQQNRLAVLSKKIGECVTELKAIREDIPQNEQVHVALTGVVENSRNAITGIGNGSTDLEAAAAQIDQGHSTMEKSTSTTTALREEMATQELALNGLMAGVESDTAALGAANELTDQTNGWLSAGVDSMQRWIAFQR